MASPHAADRYGEQEEIESKSTAKKFCRACTDFKTWSKQRSATKDTNIASNEDKEKSKTNKPLHTEKKTSLNVNCPLDKDELGRNTWSFLHTMAAYYPEKPTRDQQKDMQQFIKLFSKFYPCDICSEDMRNKLVKIPPKVKNQHELSLWFCQLHNEVNKTLGKPEFNCNLVNERWRDGWADGSCD